MRSRRPTLEDVGALANVSQATISRLLNGHTEVCTPETAERIHNAILALGYVPPGPGRRLLEKSQQGFNPAPRFQNSEINGAEHTEGSLP